MNKKLEETFDLPSMEDELKKQEMKEHIEENTLSTPLSLRKRSNNVCA